MLAPEDCVITKLCGVEDDCEAALEALAAELGALGLPAAGVAASKRPDKPSGTITLDGLGMALGATMPEGAIVVDESVTTGRGFFPFSSGAPPHDWLNNMGGSIGFGAPVAVGAAVACPDRKVIAMIGDGSAMYTLQALWTMARENLDVCAIIFSNRSYKILYSQLSDVGAPNPGPRAIDMLTLDRPTLDFVQLAKGMGVEGARIDDLDGFVKQMQYAMGHKGPYLVEVVM
jgi:acetolactate synthase-1/2/3 large subunit